MIELAPGTAGAQELSSALKILLALTFIALIPGLLVAVTAFTRIIIVLSMLRQALGMQETPPNMVLTGLALFLTLFAMMPVVQEVNEKALEPFLGDRISIQDAARGAAAPLRDFMVRHTREQDLSLMVELARAQPPATVEDIQLAHLVPAFMLSELRTAFQIGFVIFLPFLLIDLVVASVLMSMGMLMVPPVVISLPIKILMFVLVDGWSLVVRSLVSGFSLKVDEDQPEEGVLWERFAAGEAEARGQLIERYLPLCRVIAASLYAKRVADDAEFADYMQYATLGLIEAVENFDRSRGVQFNTFATYRIQGSIRNNIANFSERREQVGLIVRLKKERLESIKLGAESPRPRRGKEGELVREMAEVAVISALSYLLEGSGMLAPRTEAHYVEQFYDSLELKQLRSRMVGLVDALPDQERRVVKYHYFQNLEFTEIARIFGVTKGRVSQIHKRALVLLREANAIAGGLDVKF